MENLLKKIIQGSDGLIRSIMLLDHMKSAEITVSVMDGESVRNGETTYDWINVKFILKDIKEFNISQKARTTNAVLSSGIQFKMLDDINYLDFSAYSMDPETVLEFRSSDIYFGFDEYRYEILPYSES